MWIGLEKNPTTGKWYRIFCVLFVIIIIFSGAYEWDDGSKLDYTSFGNAAQTQTCVYMYNNKAL
jgi:hypothetical protein